MEKLALQHQHWNTDYIKNTTETDADLILAAGEGCASPLHGSGARCFISVYATNRELQETTESAMQEI